MGHRRGKNTGRHVCCVLCWAGLVICLVFTQPTMEEEEMEGFLFTAAPLAWRLRAGYQLFRTPHYPVEVSPAESPARIFLLQVCRCWVVSFARVKPFFLFEGGCLRREFPYTFASCRGVVSRYVAGRGPECLRGWNCHGSRRA